MKIALIAFYYGKLPNYFNLWLLSAKYNKDIDFLFFTDNEDHINYPTNVHKIHLTFEEMKQMIQKHIDFQITLNAPYKVCDYRPAFGLAFQDYLNGYDFWGHCELDLILGDIKKFISDEILNNYDKCFTRGYFSLYRNNMRMRELFLNKHNQPFYRYDEVFRTDYVCHFDESAINEICRLEHVRLLEDIFFADINYERNNFEMVFIQDEYKDQIWRWDNGKLYRLFVVNGEVKTKEMLLIHLQKRPMNLEIHDDKDLKSFLIVPNRFLDDKPVNASEIKEYNVKKLYLKKYTKRVQSWLKKIPDGAIQQRFYRFKKKIKYKFANNK